MMVPVDQVPKIVKDYITKIKKYVPGKKIIESKYIPILTAEGKERVKTVNLFRNKDLFNKTGFWLSRDGKWRYEISDYINIYDKSNKVRFNYDILRDSKVRKLPEVYHNKKLYEAIPELKNIKIQRMGGSPSDLTELGSFYPKSNTIYLKYSCDRETAMHEIQHAVNKIVKSKFIGTTSKIQKGKTKYEKIINYLKDPGEMEARLTTERLEMSNKQRKEIPPWVTLDRLLKEENLSTSTGHKLY